MFTQMDIMDTAETLLFSTLCSSLGIGLLPRNNLALTTLPRGRLGAYLAGLIEGDGDIYVPNNPRSPSGSINYGSISITFSIKDLPLALTIQTLIGGFIQYRGNSCHLHVRGRNLFLLISLISGYMRTPKIEALYRLISWCNATYGSSISKFPLDTSPLASNAWLAGLLDADCSFYFN